ncbi:TraC family protein [Aquibacillus sp. 3ASR75-11]|uniref:TraC family protein n=1 Tax=Terrihalobacillus insolitus TaxID=2950438 RepID=A0A9X4ALI0_9BACI|nr:TraC family protein [Terrihalobacillus insolitus]MDC3424271.1 TraC family protein [Terrihalobacillus insolitus]
MSELLIMGLFGLAIYVFARKMEKKPILPWKESSHTSEVKFTAKKEKMNKHSIPLDQEPDIFRNLLNEIKEIDSHMIRHKDNTFVLMAEVEPVNYFLLSQDEQEAIDVTFERWLAQTNYNIQFYLQNRYIDLSEPIEEMRKSMIEADDLHENAIQYGKSMVEELTKWQQVAPRYETKRYLLFTYKINQSELTADSKEELEEKTVDKAFSELYRRFNTAKSQLRKARMNVQLLTNEGICEVLYHTFNRRKAIKNRFKDFGVNEMLSLYVTADQDDARIEAVKEGYDNETSKKETDDKAS